MSPQNEIKYLVFHSHLLSLFTQCRSCHLSCIGRISDKPQGTYIAVTQECSHCGYQWTWRSQPFIRDTPAGNLLLSASILFSGATPAKVLHLLDHLKMACIKDRTFFDHQKFYLLPSIKAIWKESQTVLLQQCIARGSPLSIGGDGRCDSPGHSAKFGSYGIVDMDSKKIIHLELVQVTTLLQDMLILTDYFTV